MTKMPGQKGALNRPGSGKAGPHTSKPTDDVVPEELEKKRKRNELNESTYYSTRGTNPVGTDYTSQSLKNNV